MIKPQHTLDETSIILNNNLNKIKVINNTISKHNQRLIRLERKFKRRKLLLTILFIIIMISIWVIIVIII